jgi:hypothetical protein
MGCKSGPGNTWDAWLAEAQVAPQPLVDDSVLVNIAAQVGASSKTWTLCFCVAAMKARRMIYMKAVPGDCGSKGTALPETTIIEAQAAKGLGAAASIDPEPISQGILTGVASIFSAFTAHHAQAVMTEQDTNCQVATAYNQAVASIELAVMQGVMTPDQGSALVAQVVAQLDPVLARIAKTCNVSCGARLALKALVQFNSQIAMTALAPQSSNFLTPFLAPPQVASPGAPGTYQGASGPIGSPFTGNNSGSGTTSDFFSNLTPGEIVVIGGVAFVASRL